MARSQRRHVEESEITTKNSFRFGIVIVLESRKWAAAAVKEVDEREEKQEECLGTAKVTLSKL